jgi:hypothetical protein
MSKIYFISGHRDITEEEFIKYYEPKIWNAINEEGSKFVVGDCKGVDSMAQKFLKVMGVKDVKVYHMFEEPRYNVGFDTVGEFRSDIERDFNMTLNSNEDIAWVRKGKERSGTAQNIARRDWLNDRLSKGLSVNWEDLDQKELY